MKRNTANAAPSVCVPTHWSSQQALAVLEYLHAMREALWSVYGPQAQQAWRDQLVCERAPTDFDPDSPF